MSALDVPVALVRHEFQTITDRAVELIEFSSRRGYFNAVNFQKVDLKFVDDQEIFSCFGFAHINLFNS